MRKERLNLESPGTMKAAGAALAGHRARLPEAAARAMRESATFQVVLLRMHAARCLVQPHKTRQSDGYTA